MKSGKSRFMAVLTLMFGAGFLLAGCGGGGGGGAPAASTPGTSVSQSAPVGLFMTDDASGFRQVSAVINSVTLLNTSSGDSCTVLSGPVNIDLANLSNVMELVKTSTCPAGSFDKVRIVFSNSVGLTNSSGVSGPCSFTAFSPGQPSPDTMSCSGNNCTMDLNTPVNIVAGQNNRAGLDFDLKNFNVTGFGGGACSMTMRVNPLNAQEMDQKGYPAGISGMITSATDNTVTMNTGTRSFVINTPVMGQSNSQGLMGLAAKNVPAMANCTGFDFDSGTCQSGQVMAVATGTVSGLNPGNNTFMLTLADGTPITVNYSSPGVKGTLANGQPAVVKLFNISASSGQFGASASQVSSHAGMGPMGTPANSPQTPGGGSNTGMPGGGSNTGMPGGGSNTGTPGGGSTGTPGGGSNTGAPGGGSTGTPSGGSNTGTPGGSNTGMPGGGGSTGTPGGGSNTGAPGGGSPMR